MAGADGVAARAEKNRAESSDKITGAGETGFMPDIIIVEDNREIGTLLCDFLRKENYTVSLADTGEKALDIFERYGANLLVLDIGLPGVDGFSVCAKIREISNAHILIASARTDKESTLKGLQIGADDYIKPTILIFAESPGFLSGNMPDENRLRPSAVKQCYTDLTVDGMPVNVTEKEFQLLKLLIENRGTTLKKEYLFNRIWGSDSESEMQTLTVHIKWLREKIEQDPKNPKHIITVWGTGYRYEAL
ncbi:response regulator transcription factor [Clostridium fessum]|uniref:response regulator transcription factor n=1 Tax=Clostridium fessum TaxID=2126740 RepID=UPI00399B8A56